MVAGWPARERSGLRGTPAASMGREDPAQAERGVGGRALTAAGRAREPRWSVQARPGTPGLGPKMPGTPRDWNPRPQRPRLRAPLSGRLGLRGRAALGRVSARVAVTVVTPRARGKRTLPTARGLLPAPPSPRLVEAADLRAPFLRNYVEAGSGARELGPSLAKGRTLFQFKWESCVGFFWDPHKDNKSGHKPRAKAANRNIICTCRQSSKLTAPSVMEVFRSSSRCLIMSSIHSKGAEEYSSQRAVGSEHKSPSIRSRGSQKSYGEDTQAALWRSLCGRELRSPASHQH
ncbi:uncharacterized protein LOC120361042 [Saimiri boliviensis]|uniref:uncharacterized protein LOC120361042 n=1 Tax=Saimiri boliviensis TaxID=27679 RepID=UPI003D775DAF